MKKLIALLAIGLIAAPAFAAQWDMYGQVRLGAFYQTTDKDLNKMGESDTDLTFGTFNNSRVGAKVKVDDKLSAVVELGLGSSEYNSNAVTTRLLYADYNFGGFKLRIGQDYAPVAAFTPFNQVSNVDGDLVGFGAVANGRYTQIKFIASGFEVALSRPALVTIDDNTTTGNASANYTNADILFPRLEASYTLDIKPVKVKAYGGYQQFKVYNDGTKLTNESSTSQDDTARGYIFGAIASLNMGALYANINGYLGSNTGTLGYLYTNSGLYETARPKFINKDLKNSEDYGFAVNAGFKVSNALILEAGYGYAQTDRDDYKKADAAQSYYVNATYNIAKNFFIVPEISVEDKMKDKYDSKQGKKIFYGAKFQANF